MTLSNLRPMTVGDILDQAFTLYRKDFLTLISVIAVVSVPVAIVQLAGLILAGAQLQTFLTSGGRIAPSFASAQTPLIITGVVLIGVATLLGALGGVVQTGALAIVLAERFQGREVSVRQAYGRAFARWRPLLAMAVVTGVIYAALFGLIAIPFIGTLFAALTGTSSLGSNDALGAVIVLSYCGLCLLLPVMLVVVLSALPALDVRAASYRRRKLRRHCRARRSWQLVRGTFLRVVGIYILMSILIGLLTSGPTYVLQIAVSLLPNFVVATILNQVIVAVITLLVQPLQFAILTLLYFDLRIRKEGYDLELRAQQQMEAVQRYPAAT